MRRYLLIVPLLVACGGSETPPADSAAASPPVLTEADVAGTWTGNLMAEGSDSVIATWTDTCSAGTCRLVTSSAPNDTVILTYTIAGDSTMFTAAPYKEPMAGGAMVTDAGVARISGNQITGSGMIRLADRPDSVVMRYRFTGTRQP